MSHTFTSGKLLQIDLGGKVRDRAVVGARTKARDQRRPDEPSGGPSGQGAAVDRTDEALPKGVGEVSGEDTEEPTVVEDQEHRAAHEEVERAW